MNYRKIVKNLTVAGMTLAMMAPTITAGANSYPHRMIMKPQMAMTNGRKAPSMKMFHPHKVLNKGMRRMKMSHLANIPKGLKLSKYAKYKKNTPVIIKANHMKGMYNAKGKVDGGYYTHLYMINYRSTINHKLVKNHKWVITKELRPTYKGEKFTKGAKVISKANHMPGMYNAKATIKAIMHGPAYMIDYSPSKDETIVNHKWVTQDELAPRVTMHKAHHVHPFKPLGYKHSVSIHNKAWNYFAHRKGRLATVAPKKGIVVNHVKIEIPESNNKVIGHKHLKKGTRVNVQISNAGYVISNKQMHMNKDYYWTYDI